MGHKFSPKLTKDDVHELLQMRREGVSYADLAEAFGVDKSAVHYHLRAHGMVKEHDEEPPAPKAAPEDAPPLVAFPTGDWTKDALCAGTDPEAFFPEKGGSTKAAKATCARCLVAAECLDWAMASGERYGIWGGVSERDRRALRKLLDPTTPSDTGACGTYPKGYQRHRRAGEDPCEDCTAAYSIYYERRRNEGKAPGPIDVFEESA